MKIPKSIKLLNRTIDIIFDENFVSKENKLGMADYQKNRIVLDNSKNWKHFIDETYFHELVHWILYSMNNKLHEDEDFVSLFSCLLHQAVISSNDRKGI